MDKNMPLVQSLWNEESTADFIAKQKCMAAVFLTGNLRWNDMDADDDPVKFRTKQPTVTTFDGQFKCKDEGNEAQDYAACSNMVDQVNIAKAGETAQVSLSRVHAETTKTEALANVDPNDPLALIEAQRKIIESGADIAIVKGATKAAIAGIVGLYAGLKDNTKEEFLEYCYQNMKNSGTSMKRGSTDETQNQSAVLSGEKACDKMGINMI